MTIEKTRGKYTLTHARYVDDFGFERDAFNLLDTETRTHYPFLPPIKVSNEGKDFPINKIPYSYTEEDYQAMLDEQIARIEGQ